VSTIQNIRIPLAAALVAVLLLGACSDRDTKLSEAISAAEQSAKRAEQAAERAEAASGKAGKAPAPVVIEDEEEPIDEAEKALAEENEPSEGETNSGN
jgi:hypothetical protein